MKLKSGVLFILILISKVICFAQADFDIMKDDGGFKQKFSAATKNTTTIEASFIQEKNLSVLSEKITSKGRFLFKKENKLRWEYTEPFHYLIILNNGTMLIKDEDKQSKTDISANKIFSEINAIIIGCVQGNLFTDRKFLPSFFENKMSYLVKLKPLQSNLKDYLAEIRIFFDKNDFTVKRLEMQEPSGDYTNIVFSGNKINLMIPDEKFLVP